MEYNTQSMSPLTISGISQMLMCVKLSWRIFGIKQNDEHTLNDNYYTLYALNGGTRKYKPREGIHVVFLPEGKKALQNI